MAGLEAAKRDFTSESRRSSPSETPDGTAAAFRRLVNEADGSSGAVPLHKAAQAGGQRALEWLLANGADPNIRVAATGQTALHLVVSSGAPAVRAGAPQMVAALLNHRARPELPDRQGRMAVDLARQTKANVPNASQVAASPPAVLWRAPSASGSSRLSSCPPPW